MTTTPERGIDGIERMRLVRDDIHRRVELLKSELLRWPPILTPGTTALELLPRRPTWQGEQRAEVADLKRGRLFQFRLDSPQALRA